MSVHVDFAVAQILVVEIRSHEAPAFARAGDPSRTIQGRKIQPLVGVVARVVQGQRARAINVRGTREPDQRPHFRALFVEAVGVHLPYARRMSFFGQDHHSARARIVAVRPIIHALRQITAFAHRITRRIGRVSGNHRPNHANRNDQCSMQNHACCFQTIDSCSCNGRSGDTQARRQRRADHKGRRQDESIGRTTRHRCATAEGRAMRGQATSSPLR